MTAKKHTKQQRLVALGADVLADALLDMAITEHAVADRVVAMLANEATSVRLFQAQLKALEGSNRYANLRGKRGFSTALILLLENLKRGVRNPVRGMECVVALIAMDRFLFEECDHPDGDVTYALDFAAKEVFVPYAKACPDREKVMQMVLKLVEQDEYGSRTCILEHGEGFLSPDEMRRMVERLWSRAGPRMPRWMRDQALCSIRILADQLKDPVLREKAQ
ncbi:MAG: DUF6880 family protein [Planctomycetota bacterium]